MAIPKPVKGETHNEFISRCMGDKTTVTEYPETAQRFAICSGQWGKKDAPNPMPTPNPGEGHSDFMDRCMMDPDMLESFPDQAARIVMCQTQSAKSLNAPVMKSQGIQRAYSLLTLKAVQDDRRMIEGIATTPTPDRYDDVVEPEGMKFALPLPLLYQHNSKQPIGHVTDAKVSKDGIKIKAQIAAQGVAAYIDEAWNLIKAGLIQGLSIGFRSIEESYLKETGGFRFLKSEWLELSAVTIPANSEATITTIKSADTRLLAALSRTTEGTASNTSITTAPALAASGSRVNRSATVVPLGVPGTSRRGSAVKVSIIQQIQDTEAKRAAHEARMLGITEKAGDEGRTFNESETEEFETLEREVKDMDAHLPRLRNLERTMVARAIPIIPAAAIEPGEAGKLRAHVPIQISSSLPKGTGIARYVICLYNAQGNRDQAAELARQHYPDMPELQLILKAPVNAGTTFDPAWAAPLYPAPTTLVSEFMELLRPATILGRLPGLRRVPFNVNVPVQSGGGTFGWVGEANPKPVSSMAFATVNLPFNKVAGIVPMSKELLRFSTPSAEAVVTSSMVRDAAAFIDLQLVDPTLHLSVGVNPPSLTDQVVPKVASGTSAAAFRADLAVVVNAFITANYDPRDILILMSANIALNMSLIRNALGQKEFPDLTVNGGMVEGFPVLVSQAVGARVVFLVPSEVLVAEAGVEIDLSQEASLLMDTNPGASPVTTAVVSLYQRNLVAIRVEQMITWRKGRATTCQYISNAVYSG